MTPDAKDPTGVNSDPDDRDSNVLSETSEALATTAKKGLAASANNLASAVAERIPEDDKKLMGENLGKAGVTITSFLNFALFPIMALVFAYQKVLHWLPPRVEKILGTTPQEKLKQPEDPGAVLAALEAARFAEGEELRDMFARLIASSMHTDRYQKVHPSFAEVLKQLAPDEAKILTLKFPRPLIELRAVEMGNRAFTIELRHVCDLAETAQVRYPDNLSTYITNLCRLGLCETPEFYIEKEADDDYKALTNKPLVLEHSRRIAQDNKNPEIIRGLIDLTPFGKALRDVCGVSALPPATTPP